MLTTLPRPAGALCNTNGPFVFLANPKCEKVGCGEWERPTIDNPDFKGKWSAPLITNPNYQVYYEVKIKKCWGEV